MGLADADMEAMVGDVEAVFGQSITLNIVTSEGTFSAATGVRTEAVSNFAAQAVRSRLRVERVGDAEVSSVDFGFRASALAAAPGGTIRRGYRITEGAKVWWVHNVEQEVDGRWLVARCRSVKP